MVSRVRLAPCATPTGKLEGIQIRACGPPERDREGCSRMLAFIEHAVGHKRALVRLADYVGVAALQGARRTGGPLSRGLHRKWSKINGFAEKLIDLKKRGRLSVIVQMLREAVGALELELREEPTMTTTTGEGLRIEVPPCTTVGEGEDPLAVESGTKAQEAAHSTPRTGSGGRRRKVKTAAAVQ